MTDREFWESIYSTKERLKAIGELHDFLKARISRGWGWFGLIRWQALHNLELSWLKKIEEEQTRQHEQIKRDAVGKLHIVK